MRRFTRFGAVGLVAALLVALAPAALASRAPKARSTGAIVTTIQATATLTLRKENGRIEADFEVHTSVAGQVWKFRMKDNGTLFSRGQKTAQADGSFSVTRRTTDLAGTDKIVAVAKNTVTGEIVKATASI